MTEPNIDILVKVPDHQLPQLAALYQKKAPWAPHMVSFIHTLMKWKSSEKFSDITTIYSPNNSWEKDGTIIAISRLFGEDIILFTLDETCKNLSKALKETALITYHERTLFFAIHERHIHIVIKYLQERNFSITIIPNFFYSISPENAKNFTLECPSDVYIKKLDPSAAKEMNEVWPHRFPNSEKYIATYVEINGGYGIFLKSTNEMVAWVLKSTFGHLSLVQTKEVHKRKGYACLVAKVLSKEIGEEGFDPLCSIVQNNKNSIALFEKLGFRCIGACTYVIVNKLQVPPSGTI